MFRETVNIIDPIPREYVNTLCRLDNEPDYALTCLGIAMLRSRVEEYNGISGVYKYLTDEINCVKDAVEVYKNNFYKAPALYYYMYSSPDESAEQFLKDNGFEIKENIGTFMKERTNIKCIAAYKSDENVAIYIVNSRDLRFYHILISFISLLYPAMFKEQPLKDEEYKIVTALSKTDKNKFVFAVQETVRNYREEFTRLVLNTVLRSIHEQRITVAEQNVTNARDEISLYAEQYSQAVAKLKELIVIYEGMKATESFSEPEQELVEYMATNKALHNITINENKLEFSVATLLNNYNPDAWATFNERGYIFDGNYGRHNMHVELLNVFKDKKNRKLLLNNIFSESPEFAIKICSNYSINLYNHRVRVNKDYDYISKDPVFIDYLPNPHIAFHGCLGGYEGRLADVLNEENYISAIEICCASAGSVNLDETEMTFKPFLGCLMTSRNKVLRRRDGVDMTPEEALIYLIDKEKENETN